MNIDKLDDYYELWKGLNYDIGEENLKLLTLKEISKIFTYCNHYSRISIKHLKHLKHLKLLKSHNQNFLLPKQYKKFTLKAVIFYFYPQDKRGLTW